MRLPLGILTGMGFIGGGAILRKGDLVLGVTTAATLWFVTVVGLCFGGGQLGLGIVATVVGIFVIWMLPWVENLLPRDRHALLVLTSTANGPSEAAVRNNLSAENLKIVSTSKRYEEHVLRELRLEVQWRARGDADGTPRFLERLAQVEGIEKVEWTP